MASPALRPLSLGEVLDVSFGLYRAKFGPLIVVTVICQIGPALLRIYLGTSGEMLVNLPLMLLYYVLVLVLSSIGVAASTFIISDAYLGRETSATAALGRAWGMLGRIIGTSIASSFLIGIGFMLIIIPGILLLGGLVLSTVVAVLEATPNSNVAMGRSWELTRGFRGKVLATMLCVFVLLMVPTFAVGALWSLLPGEVSLFGIQVATAILSLFIYPFFYIVMTVLYYDLRVRKEGFDLELLAATLSPG